VQQKRLIFFGDSICHGQHVSIDKIFVTLLAVHLNTRSRPPVLVENRSVNGNTTRQALERLSYDVSSHRPQVVYVQFGYNDCHLWATDNGEPRVALPAFHGNLLEIVAKLRAAGTSTVLLATNTPTRKPADYEARVHTYNDAVRETAHATGSQLLDLAVAPGHDPETMLLADGLHLSETGHRFYFEQLREPLERAIDGAEAP
jgi:lysophospholipase L1-like esterase